MAVIIKPKMGIDQVPATLKTAIKKPDGSLHESEEQVDSILTDEALAMVTMGASFTKNMGNYESAKVSVSLSYPSQVGEVDQTFEVVKAFVDKKMEALLIEMNQASNSVV